MEAGASRRRQRRFRLGVAALVAAAAATRFHGLTSWPLFGDEFFTLRDSTGFSFSLLDRPLLFWLNHNLVQPFVPMDELGLRLLPAVFGVCGVAALALVGRRVANGRVGLWAGLLALLSPWHLAWSQWARYYTLVFLLAAVAPVALYLSVRERSRGWLATGLAATALAWLAHPTAVLPVAGFVVWLGGWAFARSEGRRRSLLLGAVALAAAGGLAAAWATLSQWVAHDQEWGIGGIWVAVSWGVRLSAGPALAAAGGVLLLWLDGRRELAGFLAAAIAVPLVVMGALGEFVSVHTGFLFATAPLVFLAGGAFLDRLVRTTRGPSARRLVVGAVAAGAVVATGLPSFVSHYVDGGRPDFREAARHVADGAGPGDLVLADNRGPFNYYTPSLESRPLRRDTARLDSIRRSVADRSPDADLWVVPYVHSQGGFGLEGLGRAREWVWRHCRLSARVDPVRIDHQRNVAEVWRCGADRDRNRPTAGEARGSTDGPASGRTDGAAEETARQREPKAGESAS